MYDLFFGGNAICLFIKLLLVESFLWNVLYSPS